MLDAEGLWTRYDDPVPILDEAGRGRPVEATNERCKQVYAEPVREELIAQRIKEIRDTGAVVAVRVSPQHTCELAPAILAAGVDLLVIQGTIVSAEHVSGSPGNRRSTSRRSSPISTSRSSSAAAPTTRPRCT